MVASRNCMKSPLISYKIPPWPRGGKGRESYLMGRADQLVERGHEVAGVEGEPTTLHPCPCCGRRTLDELGAWDICLVCWWEDDATEAMGMTDQPSGANAGVTLSAARANFLRHGLFDPARSDLAAVADPPEKYAVGRVFVFDDDGHVVEVPASAAR